MAEGSDMKALADGLFAYFEPKIKNMVKPYLKLWRAQVVSAATDGKIGVQFPFEDETVTIPYAQWASGADIGDSVWVAAPYTDLSNAVVFAQSDFAFSKNVSSVNGKTGDVTLTGAELVDGTSIAPDSVMCKADNGTAVASVYKTTDGRGVIAVKSASYPATVSAQMYALTNGGGGLLCRNGNNKVVTTLAAGVTGMQANAGGFIAGDANGNNRAVLGVGMDGGGAVRLTDASGNSYTLTTALVQKLINL